MLYGLEVTNMDGTFIIRADGAGDYTTVKACRDAALAAGLTGNLYIEVQGTVTDNAVINFSNVAHNGYEIHLYGATPNNGSFIEGSRIQNTSAFPVYINWGLGVGGDLVARKFFMHDLILYNIGFNIDSFVGNIFYQELAIYNNCFFGDGEYYDAVILVATKSNANFDVRFYNNKIHGCRADSAFPPNPIIEYGATPEGRMTIENNTIYTPSYIPLVAENYYGIQQRAAYSGAANFRQIIRNNVVALPPGSDGNNYDIIDDTHFINNGNCSTDNTGNTGLTGIVAEDEFRSLDTADGAVCLDPVGQSIIEFDATVSPTSGQAPLTVNFSPEITIDEDDIGIVGDGGVEPVYATDDIAGRERGGNDVYSSGANQIEVSENYIALRC